MSLLPIVIGVEDSTGQRVDASRPDGVRAPIILQVGEDFGTESEFDGSVTRVKIGLGEANILPAAGTENQVMVADASGLPTWGSIVDANVDASAAIAGTKVAPDFGAQAIVTTGTLSVGASPAASGTVRLPTGATVRTAGTAVLTDSGGQDRVLWSDTAVVLGGDGADMRLVADSGKTVTVSIQGSEKIRVDTAGIGFFGTSPGAGRQTVTGSKAGNVALESLIAGLTALGLIADSTT